MPLFQAIAEDKVIQWNDMGVWRDIDGDDEGFFLDTFVEKTVDYRIKPEPKYRPFANAEECWAEMQKHQPFGWVKNQGIYRNIANVVSCSITFADNEARDFNYEQAFKNYNFVDGTPFGILEEE